MGREWSRDLEPVSTMKPNYTRLAELGLHFVGSIIRETFSTCSMLRHRPPTERIRRGAPDRVREHRDGTKEEYTDPIRKKCTPPAGRSPRPGKEQSAKEMDDRLTRGSTGKTAKVQAEIDTICAKLGRPSKHRADRRHPPRCAWPGGSTRTPAPGWKRRSAASGSWSPTTTTGPSTRSSTPTITGTPRSRVPRGQRPARGVLRPDPPLHRPQDPRPPVHLRARPEC